MTEIVILYKCIGNGGDGTKVVPDTAALYIRHSFFLNTTVKYIISLWIDFYPRDAMLARVIAIATCPSVCLSVRHAPVLCQNEES